MKFISYADLIFICSSRRVKLEHARECKPTTKEMNVQGLLFILNKLYFDIILIFIYFVANLSPVTPITPPSRKRPARMSDFKRPKRLKYEQEMGLSSKPQIKLLLSEMVAPPKKLKIDVIKYEFSKP